MTLSTVMKVRTKVGINFGGNFGERGNTGSGFMHIYRSKFRSFEEPGEMVSFKIGFRTMWCFLQCLILAKSFILEDSEGINFKMVKFSEDGDDGDFEEKHI
ncbi:hypothetical protein ONZ45_g11339 [Pleurotus djamor]|nr:hypothetical protein ONZ45_g11339 [Pleurotus djamor]